MVSVVTFFIEFRFKLSVSAIVGFEFNIRKETFGSRCGNGFCWNVDGWNFHTGQLW